MDSPPRKYTYYPCIFILLFVSGFCGIAYQLIWLRMALASFGMITPVLSVVVSVFMLGLGAGSWLGGRYILALCAKTNLPAIFFYGIIELFICIGGIAVPGIFALGRALLLSAGDFNSFQYLLFSAFILGGSILPWCVCMGASIPCMMAFMRKLDQSDDTGFSYLYLANVLGGICAVLCTAGFLVELLGLYRTLLVAAFGNLSIAVISAILSKKYFLCPKTSGDGAAVIAHMPDGTSGGAIVLMLFVMGFSSMGMEVVWTRLFTPVLTNTIYSFAAILATYLLSTLAGSWLYRRHIRQEKVISTPSLISRVAYFGLLPVVFSDPRVPIGLLLYKLPVLVSIVPFCVALGYLSPKLVDEYSHGDPGRAGKAYAINLLGCVLGPLCAAYILLPTCGAKVAIIVLAALVLAYFAYYFKRLWLLSKRQVVSTAVVSVILFLGAAKFFINYEDGKLYDSPVVKRDYAATVVSFGKGMQKALMVNGISMTFLTPVTKCMAHIPLTIRDKKPESALVICLGMGTSFRSAASWGIDTTAVELVPSVRDAFGFYFSDAGDILKGPKARILVDDGRRFLLRTSRKFDLIAIDPPPPAASACSGLLYSQDFYRILKIRLRKGGMVSQWLPLPDTDKMTVSAVARAIALEFPFVRAYYFKDYLGILFLSSLEPFDLPSPDVFALRLPASAAKDFIEWSPGLSPQQLYQGSISMPVSIGGKMIADSGFSITDDRPFNEYFLMRSVLREFSGV